MWFKRNLFWSSILSLDNSASALLIDSDTKFLSASFKSKIELVNTDNVFEVVIPAVEGEIGILKDHIPIISFLKPGLIKVFSESEEQSFYVEDGIVEFKDNTLSVLTSSIFDLKDADKNFVSESISSAEAELSKDNIDDQKRFLLNHKVEVLKSISIN